MKVNNSPSFGSNILYTAKLKEHCLFGLKKNINVYISELVKKDLDTIENIHPILLNTSYGGQAFCTFSDECQKAISELGTKKRYIVVETIDKTVEVDKYKGIAQIEDTNGTLFVNRLQSISYIPRYKNIKGIGSCIMYAIIKMAEKLGKNSVTLNSDFEAAGFYRKIKMYPIIPMGFTFQVHKSRFDKVTEPIQNRFNIKPQ